MPWRRARRLAAGTLIAGATVAAAGPTTPERVAFPTQDGGIVQADVYGAGENGVVLAHGGRFAKESWARQAKALAASGFRVVAINFRGYGASTGPGQEDALNAPLHFDVLAAVAWLRRSGSKGVALIGASMGGTAAADAAVLAEPGDVRGIVLLGSDAGRWPERLTVPKLFIVARDDPGPGGVPRRTGIQAAYDESPDPKDLQVLEGSAHAQLLFDSDQGDRTMDLILRFLARPAAGSEP